MPTSLSPIDRGGLLGDVSWRGNDRAIGYTAYCAVVHNELRDIITSDIDSKGRRKAGGICQGCGAASWHIQGPTIGEGISVGVETSTAVQGNQ